MTELQSKTGLHNIFKQEISNWVYFTSQFNACVILRELNRLQRNIQILKKEVNERIKYNEEHRNEVPDCSETTSCISCYVYEELEVMLKDFDFGCDCVEEYDETSEYDDFICDDCKNEETAKHGETAKRN